MTTQTIWHQGTIDLAFYRIIGYFTALDALADHIVYDVYNGWNDEQEK